MIFFIFILDEHGEQNEQIYYETTAGFYTAQAETEVINYNH